MLLSGGRRLRHAAAVTASLEAALSCAWRPASVAVVLNVSAITHVMDPSFPSMASTPNSYYYTLVCIFFSKRSLRFNKWQNKKNVTLRLKILI